MTIPAVFAVLVVLLAGLWIAYELLVRDCSPDEGGRSDIDTFYEEDPDR